MPRKTLSDFLKGLEFPTGIYQFYQRDENSTGEFNDSEMLIPRYMRENGCSHVKFIDVNTGKPVAELTPTEMCNIRQVHIVGGPYKHLHVDYALETICKKIKEMRERLFFEKLPYGYGFFAVYCIYST